MKKFFAMILVFVTALGLVACNGEKKPTEPTGTGTGTGSGTPTEPTEVKEFAHDGTFIAFEVSTESKAAQISWVEVTVEDGKITKFFIDELQSKLTKNEAEEFNGMTWNEKSKKELGYFYGMHMFDAGTIPVTEANLEDYKAWLVANEELEWFEQAELIEAKWLAAGAESVTTDESGYINNLAGASIVGDNYVRLAKEAVANAKAGKYITFEPSTNYGAAEIVWATATVEKGAVKTLVIDTRQSSLDKADGIIWNEKSKQELGYFYAMHGPAAGLMPVTEANVEEYKAWLVANEELEWFEQVDLIAADVVANGKPQAELGEAAGVSITTNHYYAVINALYDLF